jgi:mono/diheme cytochrome c family protein
MRRIVLFLSALSLFCTASFFARQKESKPKDGQSAENALPPIPAADAEKKNPVKPTPDGLTAAKKLYGYHCAMCHAENGDGKGELAAQMKLELNDWRNPASISKYSDGALFYIITNGRGKMIGGEGDRTSEEVRWNLVNLVRSFSGKSEQPAKP